MNCRLYNKPFDSVIYEREDDTIPIGLIFKRPDTAFTGLETACI